MIVTAGSTTELVTSLARIIGGVEDSVLVPTVAGRGSPVSPSALAALDPRTALLVATSGSTGTSKIVQLSRDALIASAHATHRRLDGPGSWTCPLPPRHIAGLMTIVRALVASSPWNLVSPRLEDLMPPDDDAVPHYLSLVPTQLDTVVANAALTKVVSRFTRVLVGGAALPPSLREKALERGIPLVRTYGMTETAGGVVYDGSPLDDVVITFHLGDESIPATERAHGRISLTTPSAFLGYLGDDEATAATLSGMTVLTSDRGEWRDGRLVVTGRVDDVVQTGGVNVDLAALQRLVDDLEGQGKYVVFAVPDQRWGSLVLVARRVVGHEHPMIVDASDEITGLVARLGDRIEKAAAPRGLILVGDFPLTGSGKIDRLALRDLWQAAHGVAPAAMDRREASGMSDQGV
ncbi:MAG: AMP-binding protein [Propionibacteriaceae bacterium]|jgi:O-succinylbenzoic acid--CoA ligase|nr:AMP-binding protein [Propionibacteriaceae bacterium]